MESRKILLDCESDHFPDSVGILVHGDNHFIVRGPEPDDAVAVALARHWSLIQIGERKRPELDAWRISTREFREHLQWAVIVPGDGPRNPEVQRLLDEMSARGIRIREPKR